MDEDDIYTPVKPNFYNYNALNIFYQLNDKLKVFVVHILLKP